MPRYEFDLSALRDPKITDGERSRLLVELQRFADARDANPLEVFVPYAQQRELLSQEARIRAFFGGNRAGKTTVGVVDDLIEVTPHELLPGHLQAYKPEKQRCPRYLRCVCPSTKLIGSVFVEKFREWTPKALLKNGQFFDSYEKYGYVLRLECGCRIDFLSYEMDLDKFGGTALHKTHYDEEPPLDIREECRSRLSDFNGTELFTMTPLKGMTWMYDEVFHAAERDENIWVVRASMVDNPYLDPEGVIATLQSFEGSPEVLDARVHGNFVHFGGLVYPSYRDWFGEAPSAEFVRSCDIVCGIDPGANGFGLVFIAYDYRNAAIVFADAKLEPSFTGKGADVADAAEKVFDICEAWGIDPKKVWFTIDPSARSRSAISSATVETEFQNYGIYPTHGQNEREAGVLMVRRRGSRGMLAISEECSNLRWEMERYRVQEREDGKFDVVKRDDHCVDALRYGIMERPYEPHVGIRDRPLGPDQAFPPPRRSPKVSVMGKYA